MTDAHTFDVVIVGAGLNGLVAGIWLARRKRSVLVLDQRPVAGGAAVTTEFAPGFRAPTLSHSLGPVSPDVIKALRLDRAGLEFVTPDPSLTTIGHDGTAVSFHPDATKTAASINQVSPNDGSQWAAFVSAMRRVGTLGTSMAKHAAPAIDEISTRDWWHVLELGRRTRQLGRRELGRAARWLPMAVADVVGEWFEHDLIQAAVAAHAIFGNPVGPWSAGTGGMLLQRVSADPMPVGSGVTMRGGPGELTRTLAKLLTHAGATLQTDARVSEIVIDEGRAVGVRIDGGDVVRARTVFAAIDPKQALLDLVVPDALPPSFRSRMRHYRARGVTAKVNLALAEQPAFPALGTASEPLLGRILLAPNLDYLEKAHDAAKYGASSPEPWLELTVPSLRDPSMAPAGRHVMSIYVHFTPFELRNGSWSTGAEPLLRSVLHVLDPMCPGVTQNVVGHQVVTPVDLEQRWGLSGGHVFHGETSLDQSWVARPLLGWARHETPITGLFVGSAGTHPGGGLTGAPGLLAARAVDKTL